MRGEEIESYRPEEGLSQSTVYSIFEDAEGSLYPRIAEDGQRRMIGFVLLGEAPAEGQTYAESGKESSTDHVAFRFFGLGAITDGDLAAR